MEVKIQSDNADEIKEVASEAVTRSLEIMKLLAVGYVIKHVCLIPAD